MILLGAYAGLRVSEIAAIRGEHVDLITSTIAITGKGDKTRYIPLHPILQGLAVEMPERSWWFPSNVGNHEYGAGGPVLGNSVSAGFPGRWTAPVFPANLILYVIGLAAP
jgi:integrase/recombinase XerD